jgi:4-hydroxy-4-methyl-2-oxoglutarate aldolase
MIVPDTSLASQLYTAVISDALDALGFRNQCAQSGLTAVTVKEPLFGRCRTTLWGDLFHPDPEPYLKELKAVDSLNSGDVLIAAAHGSMRSGIWGELLTTAAMNRGCVGAIVDGAVRDISKMQACHFPVYARGACPLDSQHRQRVCDVDVPVEILGVIVTPGDLVFADADGIVFIPQQAEQDVIQYALNKVNTENLVRDSIRNGMLASDAYARYGVL